jgi:NAD(P)-dependent dehydrogenase (short-subunit alcohol dehydrogenase family)
VRRILITGGSMGIGLAVGQALAEQGDELMLIARGADGLRQAVATLAGSGHAWHAFDVSDEEAWHNVELQELHGLVCAAAVMDPIGPLGEYEAAGFRRTLEINVLGTLLAIQHALPALRATGGSVVTFAGGGATGPLPRFDAYATSKAAVVRLTENLSSEIAPIPINAVAPGFVATRLHQSTVAAGPEMVGREFFERTEREIEQGGFPATEAAELVAYLLSGVRFTGKLISAQWDPWRDPSFQQRLADEPDLATIRRIDGTFFESVAKES